MIYFIILFLIFVLTYMYDYREKEQGRLFWYLVVFVSLVVVAGLRYRIGTDSIRYESYYRSIPEIWELRLGYFDKVRWEPGFVVLMSICKSISPDFTLFQFVQSAIVNTAVFLFFWKNTKHPFFAIFLYCFYSYMALNTEVLREALAVSVFLFAWPAFKRNNFIVYLLLILLAMSFHVGASICMLCPLFLLPGVRYFFTFGKRTLYICVAILAVGFMINKMFFSYVQLLSFSATMVDRATAYAKDELGGATYNFMGILGNFIKRILYPVVAMYFLNKWRENEATTDKSDNWHIESMALMSIYISVLTIVINIFHRFNSYFFLFTLLLISQWVFTVLKVKGKKYRLNFTYWCIIFVPMLIFVIRSEFGNVGFSDRLKTYMTYYPYSSRLDPQEDRNREAVFRFYRSW